MISFYHVSDDVEAKIREGPSGDIKSYLELLDKLKDASKFFRQNNPESMELVRINELLEMGLDALAREFLQCLKKHSKPVPTVMLHDIAACEDTEGEQEHMRERERETDRQTDRHRHTHTHTHTHTHKISTHLILFSLQICLQLIFCLPKSSVI